MSIEERPVGVDLALGCFVISKVPAHGLAGLAEGLVVTTTRDTNEDGTRGGGAEVERGLATEAISYHLSPP